MERTTAPNSGLDTNISESVLSEVVILNVNTGNTEKSDGTTEIGLICGDFTQPEQEKLISGVF